MPDSIDRYPTSPLDPSKQLAERLKAIELEVAALQSSLAGGIYNQLTRNPAGTTRLKLDVDGLQMFDDQGDRRVVVGKIGEDSTGLLVLDGDGVTQRFWADEDGLHSPYLQLQAIPVMSSAAAAYTQVTSATFVDVYRAQAESISHKGLYVWATATSDSGTTGEYRVRVAGGSNTSAITVPAASGGTTAQFRWLHAIALSGGPVNFYLQARRTGGSGNVNMWLPPGFTMVDPGFCTSTGV